jgi:integrase
MASIHRRPKSQYWHAAWRTVDGILVLRSTKQTDKTKALACALEFERAEKKAGAGTLTEAQAREVLNDILKRTGAGEALRNPSVREHFTAWLAEKEAKKSEGTSERYTKSVTVFLEHLKDRADKPLASLASSQIASFMSARSKLGLAASTVNIDAKVIRTALNNARRQGLIPTNPAEAVDLPSIDSVQRGTFTNAEVKMLVDAAEGEWKTMILLAYYTGARLSDCCRMTWTGDRSEGQGKIREGVDLAAGTLTYWQHKTKKLVVIPMHPEIQALLEGIANADTAEKFLMPGMSEKGPGGRHGMSETFKAIMRKAGVDSQPVERSEGVRTLSRRTFHALRHSFTSEMANAGVASELRMKLTGHTNEATHRGYTHHEMATLRDAIVKLPGVTKQPCIK